MNTIEEQEIIRLYTIELKSINYISKKYNIGKCKVCKIIGEKIRSRSESAKISRNSRVGFKHSEESKKKMREHRIRWMKENPEKTAWRQSNISYPEKLFLEKVIKEELDKKHLIVREMSFHPYFIDFAFVNEKVAVEIDGSQHLREDKLKSDIKKNNLLQYNNWKVFRVTAKEVIFDIDKVFSNLLIFIDSSKKYESYGLYHKEYIKNYCICGKEILKESKFCYSCFAIHRRRVERPDYKTLVEEVEKDGYRYTGRKYGVSDNSIRKWLKNSKN